MKWLSVALAVCLIMCACAAEVAPPTPEQVAESALPLIALIASCPDICAFDAEPPEALSTQAVNAYFASVATASEAETVERAYQNIFAYGEYPQGGEVSDFIPPTLNVIVESALDNGAGEILASVRVEEDYGYGFELSYYMDVYLIYDASALYSAKISRVFIPE